MICCGDSLNLPLIKCYALFEKPFVRRINNIFRMKNEERGLADERKFRDLGVPSLDEVIHWIILDLGRQTDKKSNV